MGVDEDQYGFRAWSGLDWTDWLGVVSQLAYETYSTKFRIP